MREARTKKERLVVHSLQVGFQRLDSTLLCVQYSSHLIDKGECLRYSPRRNCYFTRAHWSAQPNDQWTLRRLLSASSVDAMRSGGR